MSTYHSTVYGPVRSSWIIDIEIWPIDDHAQTPDGLDVGDTVVVDMTVGGVPVVFPATVHTTTVDHLKRTLTVSCLCRSEHTITRLPKEGR